MAKATKATKYVYLFVNKKADGDGSMKPLLGGKGANLAEMSRIKLPVPPGFTLTTEVCTYYYQNKKSYPKALEPAVKAGVAFIEKIMGTKFGDRSALPLLVSVRSGARDSMPGMMDTILNLGLNDETVLALIKATRNERFAWDCYRRFVQMYGDVVLSLRASLKSCPSTNGKWTLPCGSSMKAPPSRSLRAIARRSPAGSTTRNYAPWKSAWLTCASSTSAAPRCS